METNAVTYTDPAHPNAAVRTFAFHKEDDTWYIDLPDYTAQGLDRSDLVMAEGAHKLLNSIANGYHRVTLRMSVAPFPGADVLDLVELCPAPRGGGIYRLATCNGRNLNVQMWICDIALFVFGDLPPQIYVQRVGLKRRS
ncbi:MAG: hypothetical protein EOO11_15160 [Chitinophagaceae bacterium]|nr:MAG: hypothetical protein EOO11_15160 [Chitinophagaceae bacterium]